MRVFAICLSVVFLAACAKIRKPTSEPPTSIMGNASLTLIQTIPLPGVEGRIDHLSVDIKDQRLFVAALGNNTVEVINLKTGTLIHSITGLSEPQSALFIPANNKLFVTEGGNGLCQIFDGTSFVELGRVQLAGDADNIRYDSSSKSVIVGYGEGGLSFIDTAAGQELTHIDLAGHPEAFQLESSGSRIFVNIPSSNQIAVVDRGQAKVISTWLRRTAGCARHRPRRAPAPRSNWLRR